MQTIELSNMQERSLRLRMLIRMQIKLNKPDCLLLWLQKSNTKGKSLCIILNIILIRNRHQDGTDWQTVASSLGIGLHGGLYATEDDGNPAWEDIDYDVSDDLEFEACWKYDEEVNQESKPSMFPEQIKKPEAIAKEIVKVCISIKISIILLIFLENSAIGAKVLGQIVA